MKKNTRGIMLNIDINTTIWDFLKEAASKDKVVEADLYPFVDYYRDSQVTDVLINSFCQFSQTPSLVFSDFAYKYHQKTENGIPVDYTDIFGANVLLHKKFGIDPYDVWFRRLKEIGIRPWISIRMNDCHLPDEKTSFLRSEFFYEARENGWMVGSKYGYFRYCFDYAVPEVREKMLAYLREQLTRYDVYGVELDFMREIVCFDYLNNPECHRIMTGFLREVRALVSEIEKIRGHKIAIAIRLGRDIEHNKVFGFDTEAIYNEHLSDMCIVSPRWYCCDSDMPIEEWTRRYPDMSIVAGIEINMMLQKVDKEVHTTPEVVRGYAAEYLSKGSEGIYLFNHFFAPTTPASQEIYHTCGYKETVNRLPRRLIVTYQDLAPLNRKEWKPLPLSSDSGELIIDLGYSNECLAMIFAIGPENTIDDLSSVFVNGESITVFQPTERGHEPDAYYAKPYHSLYKAIIPESVCKEETKLKISFQSSSRKKPVCVYYLEFNLTSQPPRSRRI